MIRRGLLVASAFVLLGAVMVGRAKEGQAPASAPPTFAADVAPIIYANCVSCHRPGQSAPFSLLTYADVVRRADVIQQALTSGYMPPWHAYVAPGFPELQDERGLTSREYSTLMAWLDANMPAGDLRTAPQPPSFPSGWALGTPDIVLHLARPVDVPADGPDLYRNVPLVVDLPDDRWITAIDYEPSARTVVHHALFFSGPSDVVVQDDEIVPGLANLLRGGAGRGRGAGRDAAVGAASEAWAGLGGWVPGTTPRFFPDGIAQPLPKHNNLVLQLHLHPSGKAEREDGQMAVYFAKAPPLHSLTGVQVPPAFGLGMGIDIPAGKADYTISDSFVLPVDVDAYGARGHAHYLGREMKMTATLPDGSTRGLLWIKPWDFNWQDSYFFKTPFHLPKGTRVETVIVYDNSAGNIKNPNTPPKRVQWGRGSFDEMGSMTLLVTTATTVESDTLRAAQGLQLRLQLLQLLQTARSGQRTQ